MLHVDRELLAEMAPRFSRAKHNRQQRILDAIAGPTTGIFSDYAIDTVLRITHCLAQLAHESDGFSTTVEYASGAAYEGRSDLGNTEPGDGKRYKGRGLIQLTGRANYAEIGANLGLDLESDPARAAEPVISLRIACEYWKSRDINAAADADDLIRVTRLINGGENGLEDRRRYLRIARDVLAARSAIVIGATRGATEPVLRRGSRGACVAALQTLLAESGFAITIDGDYGPATEAIVKVLQAREGLVADGIAGPATWRALA